MLEQEVLPLLSYIEMQQQKNAALEQVGDHAGEWIGNALIELADLKRSKPHEFTGESIRFWLTPLIGKPHSTGAWGALVRQAIAKKIIEPTGHYGTMLSEKSHGRETRLYRFK